MTVQDWRLHAACHHADPELFFPEGSAGPALLAVDRAKHLCETCPVQARCLDWALDHHAAFGIWGGLTEGERRACAKRLPGAGQGVTLARPQRQQTSLRSVGDRARGRSSEHGHEARGRGPWLTTTSS